MALEMSATSATPMDPLAVSPFPLDGGPDDQRFTSDPHPNEVEMAVEQRGGDPLPVPTRYDLIMRQLGQALNDREVELTGRPQGERSTVRTYNLPATHQAPTDSESPDDPVPDQFEVADFLPDEDRLLAPFGDTATVPDNDVLRFVLVKRRTRSLTFPWSVPARDEFNKLINMATTRALAGGCTVTPRASPGPAGASFT